ncbi:cytochrome c biogenesis heme-transporting ATPase CcmA [Polynucleobacter sp. HIN8]|uniref:cytochrome c biogenesis heme-transporting ATPase CcmA n=1 Tax=Polynucleobacter sp. HIN8 TaxID=3047867 RepID=UPI0025746F99|nr:cytochrome c biogenesis heme-transporting ATPase CcmA [Polynucleobacter sp. HIN8]
MSKSLRLESITCVRGDRTLFEELNLEIKPGSILRISGDNGSGKSSLLRILCGLLTPHAGKVFWGSDPITEDRDQFHGELIYLGHIPALKADFSAIENLMSLALLGGQSISNEEAMNALREAGLDRQAHRFIRTLSQGQKQRIALSRLLLPQPKSIWILDEPFNALDRDANRALQNLLINHVNHGGIVALSSHQDLQIDDNARVIRLEL